MSVIRSLVLSSAMILAVTAWADGETSMPIRNLAKGALSGIQEQKEVVIREPGEWEQFWARHATAARTAGERPKVDFSKEMVIAVTDGRRTTGGYSVEITQVEPCGEKLCITVQRKSPRKGGVALQVLTAPFHFVAVPKSELKPEFLEAAAPAK